MALAWAKDLLGDAYTEELERQIEEQIGKEYAPKAELETAMADQEALTEQLKDAKATLQSLDGKDIEAIKQEAADYKQRAEQAERDRDEKIASMQFDNLVDGAISAARGRNPKAIKAVIDMDALRASKNQEVGIKAALEAAQQSDAYLFGVASAEPTPADGTGTSPVPGSRYTQEETAMRTAAGLPAE